jgi:hypothetical protein
MPVSWLGIELLKMGLSSRFRLSVEMVQLRELSQIVGLLMAGPLCGFASGQLHVFHSLSNLARFRRNASGAMGLCII